MRGRLTRWQALQPGDEQRAPPGCAVTQSMGECLTRGRPHRLAAFIQRTLGKPASVRAQVGASEGSNRATSAPLVQGGALARRMARTKQQAVKRIWRRGEDGAKRARSGDSGSSGSGSETESDATPPPAAPAAPPAPAASAPAQPVQPQQPLQPRWRHMIGAHEAAAAAPAGSAAAPPSAPAPEPRLSASMIPTAPGFGPRDGVGGYYPSGSAASGGSRHTAAATAVVAVAGAAPGVKEVQQQQAKQEQQQIKQEEQQVKQEPQQIKQEPQQIKQQQQQEEGYQREQPQEEQAAEQQQAQEWEEEVGRVFAPPTVRSVHADACIRPVTACGLLTTQDVSPAHPHHTHTPGQGS